METVSKISKKQPFKEGHIRTLQDVIGRITHVNLHDLCTVLKRGELIDTGEAQRICHSSQQIQIRQNGKRYWYISLADLPHLLNVVSKENNSVKAICKEIEAWAKKLPEPQMIDVYYPVKRAPASTKEPVIYKYNNHPITFKMESGKIYINAKEMAHYFNLTPAPWTRLTDVKKRFPDLEEKIITIRGVKGATWFESDLALEYSQWLSKDHCFQEWISNNIKNFSSIDNLPPEPCIPDKEEWEWFKSSTIADELRIPTQRLHEYLREKGICRIEKKVHIVLPGYSALQTEVPYLYKGRDGKVRTQKQEVRWTKFGREYIKGEWNKDHQNLI